MEKKFKIKLPDQEIKPEVIEKRNKAMFTEDLEKDGILAKSLVFVYLNQPASTTEITKKMSSYYGIDFDRVKIFRALQKLNEKFILANATSGECLSLSDSERKEIHHEIIRKFYSFLRDIPEQFRRRFQNVNYFWVSNGEGFKYIEWCCKILGFECEVKKDAK